MKKFEKKNEGGIEAPNLPDYGNPVPAEEIPSVR